MNILRGVAGKVDSSVGRTGLALGRVDAGISGRLPFSSGGMVAGAEETGDGLAAFTEPAGLSPAPGTMERSRLCIHFPWGVPEGLLVELVILVARGDGTI